MPIANLQSQIQQLQTQLNLSKSPKQTKVLQSAIARLEEKLKAEAAEQAKRKAEAEAKAVKAKAEQEQKAIAQQTQAETGKKKREPRPPKKEQELKDGSIIKAVPGQGQHQFYWKVWGEIYLDENGDYHLLAESADQPIPIVLGKRAKRTLREVTLPVERFCGLHPVIVDGKIDKLQLNACAISEKQAEEFVAIGYWIAEEQTLQIQTNFRYQGKRSRNIFHQIPVRQGVTSPETGFRSLQLERDRLNVWVVGENEDAE